MRVLEYLRGLQCNNVQQCDNFRWEPPARTNLKGRGSTGEYFCFHADN